jgi:hypothetical protein
LVVVHLAVIEAHTPSKGGVAALAWLAQQGVYGADIDLTTVTSARHMRVLDMINSI